MVLFWGTSSLCCAYVMAQSAPQENVLPSLLRVLPDPEHNFIATDMMSSSVLASAKVLKDGYVPVRQEPFWLIMDIETQDENTQGPQKYVLDFGGLFEGRMGFVQDITLYALDARTKTLLSQGRLGGGRVWGGQATPLMLSPEVPLRLAIFIEPLPNAPTLTVLKPTITPLVSNALSSFGLWASFGFCCALIAAAGCLAGVGSFARWPEGFAFALYYLAWSGLVGLFGSFLLVPHIAGVLAFILATLVALSALGGGLFFFLQLSESMRKMNALVFWGLFITGLFVILFAATGIMITGFHVFILFWLIFIFGISGTGLIGIFAFQDLRGDILPYLYMFAWFLPSFALILLWFIPSFISTPCLMACLIVQFIFLISFAAHKDISSKRRARLVRAQKIRKAKILAQMRKEEESKSQNHLLRVIERERELMAELREREKDRTEQMRLAKEIADEANHAKSVFLAVVSHEIRTPMTGVLGMLRLLEGPGLSSEQKEYVATIRRSGDAMMKLLNDILDLEKAGSGQMALESIDFDMIQLVGSVVTLMSAHAAEKNLTVTADVDPNLPRYVVGDPGRLRQVLLNLVSNAIKFTSQGGVTIKLYPDPEVGIHAITFAVRDTGMGIPLEVQDRLFVPFAQAESSTSRKHGGTGLGLAICKQIIAAMGSDIRIESAQGAGTAFVFSLILPPGQADKSETALFGDEDEKSIPQTPPMKILVIEDNAINQKIVCSLLEAQGHMATSALTAEEGLDLARKISFDVIFMDVNLGGMNGMEATRSLRDLKDAASAKVPIIALTGNVGQENIRECYAAGMNGFVAKPVRPYDLYEALYKIHTGKLENPSELTHVDAWEVLDKDYMPTTLADFVVSETENNSQDSNAIWAELNDDFETKDMPDTQKIPESSSSSKDEEPPPLNEAMLHSLCESVGRDQIIALMGGFWDKAEELVKALTVAADKNDAIAMGARGHEMKGMAGNFGIEAISVIAGQIERTAKIGQTEKATALARRLPSALAAAHEAFDRWMVKTE